MGTCWTSLATAPAYGMPAANFVPTDFRDQAQTVAQRNAPPKATADFVCNCANSLIARGLFARHKVAGDCEAPSAVDFSNVQITAGAGQIAGGIASMAGTSIPGLGAAISAIESIFAHHAEAVANEQKIICYVAGVVIQTLAYYDRQVRTGALAPASAASGLQSFFSTCVAQLQTIYKSCNAACQVIATIKAHADFITSYYPYLAPVQAASHAPGAAPVVSGTVPGGVVQVGNAISSTLSSVTAGLTSTEKFILLLLALGVGGYVAYEAAQ